MGNLNGEDEHIVVEFLTPTQDYKPARRASMMTFSALWFELSTQGQNCGERLIGCRPLSVPKLTYFCSDRLLKNRAFQLHWAERIRRHRRPNKRRPFNKASNFGRTRMALALLEFLRHAVPPRKWPLSFANDGQTSATINISGVSCSIIGGRKTTGGRRTDDLTCYGRPDGISNFRSV